MMTAPTSGRYLDFRTNSHAKTTMWTYDGDGLRRQTVTAAATINFIWDGQDVLARPEGRRSAVI